MCIITWKWDEMNSNHNGPRTLAVTSHCILAGSHCLGACALVCTLSQSSGQSTSSTASKPPLSPQAPPTPTNTTTRQSSTTLLQSTICSRLCTTHEPSHPTKMHRELVSLREKEKEGARESEHISERAASWAACHCVVCTENGRARGQSGSPRAIQHHIGTVVHRPVEGSPPTTIPSSDLLPLTSHQYFERMLKQCVCVSESRSKKSSARCLVQWQLQNSVAFHSGTVQNQHPR